MREAIDTHAKAARPSIAEIVERVGPMKNKSADESGAGSDGTTRERRGARRRG